MVHSISATSMLGKTIDGGRLRLVKVLGAGSSGVVFLALELSFGLPSGPTFAVKCITRAERGTPQNQMQRREMSFHRSVSSHPNILTLHRVIEEGRYLFFILDYYNGGDLFKMITEGGYFRGNDAMVKKIFLQILDAVEACHNKGIYHRDIKPENILCSSDGTRVCLADFGLATKNAFSTNFGAGSFSYMSPECLGLELDTRYYSSASNDVWALGVILTSLISGRNPWRYATTSDECYVAYLQNPEFLRSMLPISDSADLILRRIFTRGEYTRISLPCLRQMIVDIDTFFMTRAEIANASEQVRRVAASYYGTALFSPNFQETCTSYGFTVPSSLACPDTPQSDLESEGSGRNRNDGLIEVPLSPMVVRGPPVVAPITSPQTRRVKGIELCDEPMDCSDVRGDALQSCSMPVTRAVPNMPVDGENGRRTPSTIALFRRIVQRIAD